jgi:transposase
MPDPFILTAFGLDGNRLVGGRIADGEIVVRIERPYGDRRCPQCGSQDIAGRGGVERSFRGVPLGSMPVRVALYVPRVECRACGVVRQVELGFADPRVGYTKAFERYALALCRHMTIADVAEHLGVGWDLVKDIQKRWLSAKYAEPELRHVRRLAIDEIAVRKGHKYVTIVMDLDTGVVVFVGDGKGADALEPFWERLKRSRAKVAAVAIDMSAAYIQAVQTRLATAEIVFDRFHVVKLLNEKLSQLRRDLQREAESKMGKAVLKGTRWLLLKNPENLDAEKNERKRLEEALRLNRPLATAYYMKEELRQFWSKANRISAERFLDGWIKRAGASGIAALKAFGKTLAAHRSGLLAWYRHRISTGPLEGTNNKIKTMKRMAYGYRDHDFFKLKILALHETKYALVG